MHFILVVMIWLMVGMCLAGGLVLWLERRQYNANMAYRNGWRSKVKHAIRRVLLY